MRRRRRGLGIKEIEGYGQRDERRRMLGDVSVEEGLSSRPLVEIGTKEPRHLNTRSV